VSCELVERDLTAYLDRELDLDAATAIRLHLAGCTACRRLVAEREALGRLVRSAPYYPAPQRLRTRVSARTGRSLWLGRFVRLAAAAALPVSVGARPAIIRLAPAATLPIEAQG